MSEFIFIMVLLMIGALVWLVVSQLNQELDKVKKDEEELNRAIQDQRRLTDKLRSNPGYRDWVRKHFNK